MKWIRLLFALTFGLVAGIIVWLWPVTPIWRIPTSNLRYPIRFHPEKNILYTHYRSPKGDPESLCRWNVSARQLEGKTEFAQGRIAGLSGDCQRFFFNNAFGDVAIADVISGKLVQKLTALRLFDPQQTPSDSRYYYSFFQEEVHRPNAIRVLRVSSIENGESLFDLKGQTLVDANGLYIGEEPYPFRCSFSSQSDSLAVLWHPASKAFVTIHSLPDGKETARFLLPDGGWDSISEWDGRHLLMLRRSLPDEFGGSWFYSFFDTKQTQPATPLHPAREIKVTYVPEPAVEQWHLLGQHWICQFQVRRIVPPFGQWFVDLQEWLRKKTGWRPFYGHYECTIKKIDRATGNYRLISLPNRGGIVSADGRYLASTNQESNEIEIWDLDPVPRWCWALAGGTATGGSILLLGYWRAKRKQRILPTRS